MNSTKMLQAILDKVTILERKVDEGFKNVKLQFKETHKRIDKLDKQFAYLEDDTPTIADFEKLETNKSI